jgi:putrescine---pyruvate transaminase
MNESSKINFLHANNGKHTFHPMGHPAELEQNPARIIDKAEGVYVFNEKGEKVVDAVGGLWNVNLGYSNERVKKAITDQLDRLPYYSNFKGTTNPPTIELGERLVSLMKPEGMVKAFFTSGGSDSIESALKIARQYWKMLGQKDRYKFLSFKKGYHGTHFGGASVNGGERFHRSYEPLLPGCFHMPYPAPYRNPFGIDDEEQLVQTCLKLIEEEIQFQSPDTIAAFIAEPVLGAGGVYVPTHSLWQGLRALCDKYEILLIADEVVTGFGRTGEWFGSRYHGVAPDIMCLAKAITSGYFPFGAAMVNERINDAYMTNTDPFGGLFHGYTYTGHPVGCAAALATLDETYEANLAGNAKEVGSYLISRLKGLQDKYEMIGEVRGVGLMMSLDLVSDRSTKAPAAKELMGPLADHAWEAGVMIRVSGNVIIMSPPLVLTKEEADKIADGLDYAFGKIS